ncbi:hypothetical protein IQ251_09070 [Saccharopolyspora sp. HNM0983]|uniref:Uncharacterized protein n=1 Tax=Saccharopolyspora montiporae TaxID=2781240 RepID=A0A929B7E0_9PSEU|nr:hypothetical protein [Saccharopolyspora sp. HNM0983]MBE9374597.1 hypothetical protein [Saccharopolyspora sp. HNM0983]
MDHSWEPSHPLEAVYRARDALQEAVTEQPHMDLTKQDLPSYGRALRATLDNLGDLARLLSEQVDRIDRDRLYRGTLSDHPYEVIDTAVDHLIELRRTLETAARHTESYRSDAEHVHHNTRDEHRPRED